MSGAEQTQGEQRDQLVRPEPPERLVLLQVHAHPDDEASKGAGTTARYAAEGVRNVLVCCTGGEAGDILNPAVEHPGSAEAMHALRTLVADPERAAAMGARGRDAVRSERSMAVIAERLERFYR